ncbi:3-deoxy-manno-octulosonate cytidylyltransferase [Brumimicrobium oceani]|uniref:3-deoxy-manno-octulosonate cytidylyltransferase n=1 Tax=Brumimicrobium oceani TaxID=2100725 RepID=A0A2U2XD48_9FLAO|nr:3-deoxy-manno-octulosonate cytidylyltransferase [Brumimicrobium oceani]PWH85712.1 3-deoxy-manno-octulosonate cytidylyltransferase [Brumimicrobium oceani]
MKKLAIIPARYASSRFPGKPLIDLAGKTMIQRVLEGVTNSKHFDEVVVATDNEKIANHIKEIGGKAMLTKASHESGTDRCGEVIESYSDFDIVVNIQGDEPLVDAEQLRLLLAAFEDETVEIATLGSPKITSEDRNDSNRIKVVVNHKSDALYFSRSPIPFERNQENYPFLKHIGLYGFRTNTLKKLVQLSPNVLEQTESLEQLRWMYYGYKIRVVETDIETPNIDTPEDVEVVLKNLK